MAEKRQDRTERPAEWKTRPGSGAADDERVDGDDVSPEEGSHFEGDFGAEALPRKAAGVDRNPERTDRPER
jgi:hypothetical protein